MKKGKLAMLSILFLTTCFVILSSQITKVSAFDLEDPSGARLGFSGDPSSSMTISWWTASNNTDSKVYYGLSPTNLGNVATGTKKGVSTGYIHDVEISGLQGGTKYFYKAGGESGNSSVCNFTTAPSSKSSNVHFVAYGDTRSNYTRRRLVRNMILDAKDWFGTDAELVLNSGDIVAQGEIQGQYDNYSVDMEPLSSHVPIMHIAGNHDDDADTKYPQQFIEPTNGNDGWYYSFNWGSVHFIGLNTEDSAEGNDDPSFLAWLENDLQEANEDEDILWIVAWYHKPQYASFSHGLEGSYLWETWGKLFWDYDVDIIFNGHCHAYQRNYPINWYGNVYKTADPDYINPPYPVHIVSGAGAVHSESYVLDGSYEDNLSNDTFHAKWSNGDYVFFPSNHYSNVRITLDEETMTTKLQMNVVGLNYTKPNITEDNYSVSVVDRMSITKDIPEGFFGSDDGNDIVLITVLVASLSSGAVVMVIAWKIRRDKMRKRKGREGDDTENDPRDTDG